MSGIRNTCVARALTAPILPVALTLAATTCEPAPPGPPPSQTQTEDSAGILIVENARPETGSRLGWQVSQAPATSIGTVTGGEDFQLHQVGDALKLPDGRIVVANGGSQQLLVFDDTGNYLEAWGQRGEGPGDFSTIQGSDGLGRSVFWMERWPGDSLAVCSGSSQAVNNVVSIWDTRGRHGRTLNLTRINRSKCRDVLAGGAILASRRVGSPSALPEKGTNRSQEDFSILAGDGSPLAALGRHPGGEIFWYFEDHMGDGTGMGLYDPPFRKTLWWAAWGDFVVLAPTDRYELRAYRHDGSLARIVRRQNDVRSPTQADVESYREAYAPKREETIHLLKQYNATVDAFPLPESFPAFTAIEVDALGYLWVREYNPPGNDDRALWSVFDSEGFVQGFVETPPRLVIHQIGEDFILGKVLDELGVEYVQLWGLDRREARTGRSP